MIFASVCPPARLSHGPQQPLCPGCPPFPNPQLATAAASRGVVAGCLPKAIAAQLFTPYMLNLGLLPTLPLIDHELGVVFHHEKPHLEAGQLAWLACLCFSRYI